MSNTLDTLNNMFDAFINFFVKLGPRLKVVFTAAVTWITFAITFLTVFSEELLGLLPETFQEDASTFIAQALVWLVGAISVIRRVTPVVPEERGVLDQQQG